MLTVDEARAMRGTEFNYFIKKGVFISAFVKEFYPGVGLSCYSLAESFSDGSVPRNAEADGSACMVGIKITSQRDLDYSLKVLSMIRDTGEYWAGSAMGHKSICGSGVSCSFS